MSKIVKPDLTYQWASAAGGGSVAPNSTKIQTGHIVEKPNYEYMNWLQNRQDKSIAYTFQMGVPEWDSLVEYQYHANYKSYVQRNGLIYKALQVGTNKDPATEAAYWELALDNYGSAATVQSNLNTHITNYGTLASLSNVATARTNLNVYSKGEGDARYAALGGLNSQLFLVANGTTGYEAVNKSQLDTKAALAGSSGQLFSAANGTTSYEVVNKSQLDTKAPVAGNAAQEFAVATATTGNSAVNKSQLDTKAAVAGNNAQVFKAADGVAADDVATVGQALRAASETVSGQIEIATQAEANALVDSARALVPAVLTGIFQQGQTLSTNGSQTFVGGLIIKWGTTAPISANTTTAVSFPVAFPNSAYAVFTTKINSNVSEEFPIDASSLTVSGFNITNTGTASIASYYFAIGK